MISANGHTPRVHSRIGVRMDEVERQRISWLSMGRIAEGKMTMLDGDPGLGKSTLLMYFAALMSRGKPLPDGPVPKRKGVILICGEDDPADTIRPRLEVEGADLTQVTLMVELPVVDEDGRLTEQTRLFSLPDDVPLLEKLVIEQDVGLIIIDPLMAFFNEELRANSDQDVRAALSPLATMLQRTGAACLLVRHLNKGASANSLYRGGGSIGIIGIARFGLLVAKDPKDPDKRVLAVTKSNLGKPARSLQFRLESVPGEDVARIDWLGEVDVTADDLLGDTLLSEDQKAEAAEADEFVLSVLQRSPMRRESLIAEGKRAGISARSIDKAKKRLGILHTRCGTHLGLTDSYVVWHLPGTTVSDLPEKHTDGETRA